MNTLKYSLEYHCYPIWNYGEDGMLIDNDLPDELRSDAELDCMLLHLQKLFDSQYVDTHTEFSARDLTESQQQQFNSLLSDSLHLLKQRYGSKYNIECKYIT